MKGAELIFKILVYIHSKKEDIYSFLCGDVFTMILTFHFSFLDASVKLFGAFAVGIVGGLGGLLIKDIYVFIKDFTGKLYKHLTRKRGL